jgi:hypothetical protein
MKTKANQSGRTPFRGVRAPTPIQQGRTPFTGVRASSLTTGIALVSLAAICLFSQTVPMPENPYTELRGDRNSNKQPTGALKPTPRTPDGKPDLSGFWKGPLIFGGMFKSVGGPPFTSAGEAAYQFNVTKSINPEGLCLFAGIPRASISGVPFEIVQNKTRVAFLYELMTTFRSIPVDGRDHPKDIEPSFFGNGIGKWDGDTLVIDSIGFKEKLSWIDDDAHPHSDAMHVVERWSRPDADHLAHEVWVEDPKYYSKPWTFKRVFTVMPPGDELYEMACDENNIDRDGGHLGYGPLDLKNYPLEPKISKK